MNERMWKLSWSILRNYTSIFFGVNEKNILARQMDSGLISKTRTCRMCLHLNQHTATLGRILVRQRKNVNMQLL
jgi:hypothetical protein